MGTETHRRFQRLRRMKNTFRFQVKLKEYLCRNIRYQEMGETTTPLPMPSSQQVGVLNLPPRVPVCRSKLNIKTPSMSYSENNIVIRRKLLTTLSCSDSNVLFILVKVPRTGYLDNLVYAFIFFAEMTPPVNPICMLDSGKLTKGQWLLE